MNSKTSDATQGRRSIRLAGYDYSAPGGDFITVVAFRRECLFGEITGGNMKLSPIGEIVRREWFKTAELRPYVELHEDEFVVMPNHVHGIIWIIEDHDVGARRRRAPTSIGEIPSTTERFGKPVAGSIPTIVRAFKSAVTYCARRELNSANIWQPIITNTSCAITMIMNASLTILLKTPGIGRRTRRIPAVPPPSTNAA